MRFDFSSVDDVESYVSVPAGPHNVRIAEVREGVSREGSTRWTFRLEVIDGDYAGRTAAWDSITWSERGVFRVKKVFEALGLDVRGEIELESTDLVNLQACVTVTPEEREDPLTGRRQVRMRVPYLGYAPLHRSDDESSNGRETHEDEGGRGPRDGLRAGDRSADRSGDRGGDPRSTVDGRSRGGESGSHAATSDDEDERPF